MNREPGAAGRCAPFPVDGEQYRGGKKGKNDHAITHTLYDALTAPQAATTGIQIRQIRRLVVPARVIPHPMTVSTNREAPSGRTSVRKATSVDLKVGLICADRDGNRIRIDHIDPDTARLSYHFLNDELRVQEGIQETSIPEFLAEGWYIASAGAPL